MSPLALQALASNSATSEAWDGYYINLDRSSKRRRYMTEQLAALGMEHRYRRFPAVDGRRLARSSPLSPGEVGIFRSHLDILEEAASTRRAVHVIEDDVVLCDLVVPAIDLAVERRIVDEYDILFLEFMPQQSIPTVRYLHELFTKCAGAGHQNAITSAEQLQIIDIRELYLWGATSYVIGPRNVDRVLAALRAGWRAGPTLALDRTVEKAIQTRNLRAGSFFPFISTINLDLSQASTAGRGEAADDALTQRILRYSFFARRDIAGRAAPAMAQVIARHRDPDPEGAVELYVDLMRYYLVRP